MDIIGILRNTHASLSASRIGESTVHPRIYSSQQEVSRHYGDFYSRPFRAMHSPIQNPDGSILFLMDVSPLDGSDKIQ